MENRHPIAGFIRHSLLVALAALPLFFLPLTQEFYELHKWLLFSAVSIGTLCLWSFTMVRRRSLSFSWSPATAGLSALALVSLLSLLFVSKSRIEAIVHPFGVVTFVNATVLLFFLSPLLSSRERRFLILAFQVSVFVLSVVAIYQEVGMGVFLFPGVPFMQKPLWSPAGSPFALLCILLATMPLYVRSCIASVRQKYDTGIALSILAGLFTVTATALTVWRLLPIIPTAYLPIIAATEVMVKAFGSIQSLFLGVGADGFPAAFTLYKPLSLNATPLWATAFAVSTTFPLHIATTLGLLGFLALSVLLFGILGMWTHTRFAKVYAVFLFLLAIVSPPVFVLVPIISIMLLGEGKSTTVDIPVRPFHTIAIAVVLVSFLLTVSWALGRWYDGERLFYQALRAAESGNGSKTYQFEIAAIEKTPAVTRYRLALARTCLSLAANIIKAAPADAGGKPNLTEDDIATISELTKQAIREIKLAVTLSPQDVMTWNTMALLYRDLIGIAKDADTWSIAAYKKAITLDPGNPVLRLDLGTLYMGLSQYDNAHAEFLTAVTQKPDYANAYYNLGLLFVAKKQPDDARKAFLEAQKYVAPGSADFTRVSDELKKL